MGECFVFKLLEKHAGPAFVEQFGEWRREDVTKEHADFTYADTDHHLSHWLSDWLAEQGLSGTFDWLVKRPKYHIEVKSTTGSYEEPFQMSSLQMAEARRMSPTENPDTGKDAIDFYLLFRVYNLSSPADTRFEIRVDPWKLFKKDDLEVKGWLLALK
jgi:hypothetical protein